MSGFRRQQLDIGGDQPLHKLKLCNKCEELRPPEGGIELSTSRWYCGACWTRRATSGNLSNAKTKTAGAVKAKGSQDV
jgi:hypothetical protein